jgi:vacuolar protein sorting-associated protein 33A
LTHLTPTSLPLLCDRYQSFRERPDAPIAEIHEFVKRIPALQNEFRLLNQHINIAELLRRTTDAWTFREQWQRERGALEGETILDVLELDIMADVRGVTPAESTADQPGILAASLSSLTGNREVNPDGTRLSAQDNPDRDMWVHFRLLCLQSVASGGIRASKYDAIRRLLVQTYGLRAHLTLLRLEKCGFLKRKEVLLIDTNTGAFGMLRQRLRLISDGGANDATDAVDPSDMGYITAGYATLTGRLVQVLGNHSTVSAAGLSEILGHLPGPTLEFHQKSTAHKAQLLEDALEEFAALPPSHHTPRRMPTGRPTMPVSDGGIMAQEHAESGGGVGGHPRAPTKPYMLVLFTGGASWTEVAALRFLSRDAHFPFHIIMASTAFQSGTKFLCEVGK